MVRLSASICVLIGGWQQGVHLSGDTRVHRLQLRQRGGQLLLACIHPVGLYSSRGYLCIQPVGVYVFTKWVCMHSASGCVCIRAVGVYAFTQLLCMYSRSGCVCIHPVGVYVFTQRYAHHHNRHPHPILTHSGCAVPEWT